MKRSIDRILTTHTGSLPRPANLLKLHEQKESGEKIDMDRFYSEVRAATDAIVKKQINTGLDIINDGEMGKVGYATYVKERLAGFEAEGGCPGLGDLTDFPDYERQFYQHEGIGLKKLNVPACNGEIKWKDFSDLQKEIDIFIDVCKRVKPFETFLSAASPGVIALYFRNEYYDTYSDYLFAIADVMKREYNAIHEAGCVLQLDCPDLAYGRHTYQLVNEEINKFIEYIELNIAAINYSISDIPPESVRIHLCWGNYEGPHHKDIDLKDIIFTVFKANVGGICFEAANPRHGHEWRIFQDIKIPNNMVLIPGVIDTCTNYIEHPDLVAERIERYVQLVGRENVIAGTDCGFATFAGFRTVDQEIAWAKLAALTEGARRASSRLW